MELIYLPFCLEGTKEKPNNLCWQFFVKHFLVYTYMLCMNNEWYALADTILTLILFSGSQFKNWSFTNTCGYIVSDVVIVYFLLLLIRFSCIHTSAFCFDVCLNHYYITRNFKECTKIYCKDNKINLTSQTCPIGMN